MVNDISISFWFVIFHFLKSLFREEFVSNGAWFYGSTIFLTRVEDETRGEEKQQKKERTVRLEAGDDRTSERARAPIFYRAFDHHWLDMESVTGDEIYVTRRVGQPFTKDVNSSVSSRRHEPHEIEPNIHKDI